MTGNTHRKGGMLFSVIGFLLLKFKGFLLPNINEFIQLCIIYPFCMWGSLILDADHHWGSCPLKDIPAYLINKLLHITTPLYRKLEETLTSSQKRQSSTYKIVKIFSASHRSWQTHSDLTLIVLIVLLKNTLSHTLLPSIFTQYDYLFLALILTGVIVGAISHLFLDCLTPEGIHLLVFKIINIILKHRILPEKLHFVPSTSFFKTGSNWEKNVNKVLKYMTVVGVFIVFIVYLFPDLFPLGYHIEINFPIPIDINI